MPQAAECARSAAAAARTAARLLCTAFSLTRNDWVAGHRSVVPQCCLQVDSHHWERLPAEQKR
eukprot:165646-Chlamydomonas_euryale.AAC.7